MRSYCQVLGKSLRELVISQSHEVFGIVLASNYNKVSHSQNPRFYYFSLVPSEGTVTPLWYISILTF